MMPITRGMWNIVTSIPLNMVSFGACKTGRAPLFTATSDADYFRWIGPERLNEGASSVNESRVAVARPSKWRHAPEQLRPTVRGGLRALRALTRPTIYDPLTFPPAPST